MARECGGRTAERLGWPAELYDPEQLALGTRHELEHTGSMAAAQRIAMDHLAEQVLDGKPQDYYTRLQSLEVGAWFWTPLWRTIQVYDPQTRKSRWLGLRSLTRDAASNWLVDTANANWNLQVSPYTYEGGRWRYGL